MGLEDSPQSGLFTEATNPPAKRENAPENTVAFKDDTSGLPQTVSATHPLPVDVGTGITLTAGQTDSSAYTPAVSNFAPIGGINDPDMADVPDGEAGAAKMTANRAIYFSPRDPSGNPLGGAVQSTPLAFAAASAATRTSGDIAVNGRGLILVVLLANKAGTVTFTPKIQGKTASGAYYDLWTAAAGLTANGTAVYQLSPDAVATAGGVTESKIALIPGVVRVLLTYTGAGGANNFDTTVDIDVVP